VRLPPLAQPCSLFDLIRNAQRRVSARLYDDDGRLPALRHCGARGGHGAQRAFVEGFGRGGLAYTPPSVPAGFYCILCQGMAVGLEEVERGLTCSIGPLD
jgi:hypothetical protein